MTKVVVNVDFIINTGGDVLLAVQELELALSSLGDDLEDSVISDAVHDVVFAAQLEDDAE